MPFEKVNGISESSIFTSAFTHAGIGMAIVSLAGKWIKVNSSLCNLLGYSEQELEHLTFQDLTHPEDLLEDLEHVQALLDKNIDSYQMEKRYVTKSKSIVHVVLNVSLVADVNNKPLFFIAQIQDITKLKQYENELLKLISTDHLTNIGNRRHFYEQAEREINRSARADTPLTLLMIDIDNFKTINDKYGHSTGDIVLIEVARICKETIRALDILGRIGGEEFAILLIDADHRDSHVISERLRINIENATIAANGHKIHTTVSIGAATFIGETKTIDHRMRHADDALYKAKARGRNRTEFYIDPEDIALMPHKTIQSGIIQLSWEKFYKSGNHTIDSQHLHLFEISNILLSSLVSNDSKEHCKNYISELTLHITNHFHDEEAIIRISGYEFADAHSTLHNDLTNSIIKLSQRYQADDVTVGEILSFLAVEVIYNHMVIEDKKFYHCLKK